MFSLHETPTQHTRHVVEARREKNMSLNLKATNSTVASGSSNDTTRAALARARLLRSQAVYPVLYTVRGKNVSLL